MGRWPLVTMVAALVPGCFTLGENCFDGEQNAAEEGVDCGGTCEPCPPPKPVDPCENVTCDGKASCVEGECISPCENGTRDEGETDVDCGGADCRKCAGGHTCKSANDCFSGMCLAATGMCYELVSVSFGPAVSYMASFKPYALTSGDVDGDGKVDLVVANEIASTVGVYRNTGGGAFAVVPATTQDGFPTGAYPTGIAVADFNGDGVKDVVSADYHGNSVSILFGTGAGTMYRLGAPTSYATMPMAETSTLAIGDLDGDGITDVVAANPQRSSVSVFIGRSNGTLVMPATDVPCSAMPYTTEPYSVAIADFDMNGTQDIAAADNRTRSVFIKLGNGTGAFTPGPELPAINGSASFIMQARDMNLDGIPDLVIANRGSNDISVLRGKGDGRFYPAVVSPTGAGTGPYSLAIADFNLDAIPDVITANYLTNNASVLLGIGNGGFEPPLDTGMVGSLPYGIAVGDFNGDGKIDFATANAVANTISVKLSTAQ
jgi:hypothetical protein